MGASGDRPADQGGLTVFTGSTRTAVDRLLAIGFVLFVTVALAGIVSTGSSASFTGSGTNPSNTVGSAALNAPTSLSASIASNGADVNLSWTATTSSYATGTRVYRSSTSGGPYSLVQTIAGLATTTWSESLGGNIYYYVVRAYYTGNGANWESANSSQVVAKPLDHFSFANVATQHSAVAFNVTITAQAADNSTVNYSGTVSLSTNNSATISPLTSGAFSAGVRTESVTLTGAYKTNQTITATGGTPSRTGTSNAFTLNHFRATAIAINNKAGGTAGKPENGDTIVITFSEAAGTASLGTCSAGSSNSGTDLVANNLNPDTFTANGTKLLIGAVSLGGNAQVTATRTWANSTCAWSGSNTILTITLAGGGSAAADTSTLTATYTPNAAITSATGEAIDTAQTPTLTAVLF